MADLTHEILKVRAENMALWSDLALLCDKVEIIRIALANDPKRATAILSQIATNDEKVAALTRALVEEYQK